MGETFHWFHALDDPTNPQSNFAMAVLAAGAAWFKFYVDSGKKNNE
jgi:hypothetical protein